MTGPRPAVVAWIAANFPGAGIEPLSRGASTRLFFRVRLADESRVLMDYGRPFAGESADMRMARIFLEAGLPVARVEAASAEVGCLLLEDLGDRTLEAALAGLPAGDPERGRLYERAVDLLVRVARQGTETLEAHETRSGTPGPALDAERFRYEMDFFLEHYARGLKAIRALPPELPDRLHELAERASGGPHRVLCHRDYHSRNLMVGEDGCLTMVDIQDARWGPDTYDVASLLRDAYADLDEPEVERLLERYRCGLPGPPDPGGVRSRFHVVGAQRMIKALGTFGYQVGRLGRDRYRDAIPRTVARLQRLLPLAPHTSELGSILQECGLLASRAPGGKESCT